MGKAMVQNGGTFDTTTLSVPEGYLLAKNGNNYYAAEAFFEITYTDGTTKKCSADTVALRSNAKKITLLKDVSDFADTFSSEDGLSNDFILDLGGHSMTGTTTAESAMLRISVPMKIGRASCRERV